MKKWESTIYGLDVTEDGTPEISINSNTLKASENFDKNGKNDNLGQKQ